MVTWNLNTQFRFWPSFYRLIRHQFFPSQKKKKTIRLARCDRNEAHRIAKDIVSVIKITGTGKSELF